MGDVMTFVVNIFFSKVNNRVKVVDNYNWWCYDFYSHDFWSCEV